MGTWKGWDGWDGRDGTLVMVMDTPELRSGVLFIEVMVRFSDHATVATDSDCFRSLPSNHTSFAIVTFEHL